MQTALFVLFFLVLGLSVVLVAMRSGSKGPVLDSSHRGSRRVVGWLLALSILAFVVAIPLAVVIHNNANAEADAGALRLTKKEQHGREVFNRNCTQCHVLAASNGVQQVGPNLDDLRPPKALVLDAIKKGRAGGQGQMPSQVVTGPDAEAVASYVARVAGRTSGQ
jgi:mono/diheme cytochrome c family protein